MDNKEKNFASAVVYVHNAERTVGKLLGTVISVLEENFEHSEIICVNDASSDSSVKRIREAAASARSTSVSIVNMSYFHGIEIAMNAGVDLTIGDFVFEFDCPVADFAPDTIMEVYRRSLTGCDIVSAIPERREKLSSRLFYRIFDRFTELSYEMHTESFRVLSRRVINRVSSMTRTVPYRKAVYANQGLRTDAIRYVPLKTEMPDDRREKRYRSRLAADSLILFTEVGYRFSIAMTILMMVMSVVMGVYSLVVYLTAHPVEGWTTLILFMSFAFFGLFGVLTIVIKYLQILVGLVFKRKQYSYEGIEKLTK